MANRELVKFVEDVASRRCVRVNPELLAQFVTFRAAGRKSHRPVTERVALRWVGQYDRAFNGDVRPISKQIFDENAF